jgi:hypothetical protein
MRLVWQSPFRIEEFEISILKVLTFPPPKILQASTQFLATRNHQYEDGSRSYPMLYLPCKDITRR